MSWPRVAVVGAGLELAGDVVLLLLDNGIAADHIRVVDLEETAGDTLEAGDLRRRVEWATPESLAGADVALFCGNEPLARALIPIVRARGAIVIDATGSTRDDEDVMPLVPEVNGERLTAVVPGMVIACPSPAVVGLALALAPLHRLAGLRRVVVTAIEPASQRGAAAIDELSRQSVHLMQGQSLDRSEFSEQIAFNFRVEAPESEGGATVSESAIARELRRLLDVPELAVTATVVRAPVFFGSAQAVHLDVAREVVLADAELAIRSSGALLLAGSVEDRLAVAVEAERRRKARAAAVQGAEDERDVAQEMVEDGLEMEDAEEERDEPDDDPYREEREDDEEDEPARPRARAEGRPPAGADEPIDLVPGPVDVAGSGFVHVARLRVDPDAPGAIALWIAFDELRRGIAMNAVAIVELVRSRRA